MREIKNYETEATGGGSFVMGVLCGAAVGAAVGMLLAPKAGSELRQQIYESTGRLRRRATEGYEAAADTVATAVNDVLERGSKAVEKGQEVYEDVRHAASKATSGRV